MTAFAAQVLRSIRAQGLLSPGARVAVAVSGGPDSTALLLVMLELAPSLDITVDSIVHVNHQLRGAASDADARHVSDLAQRHGLECAGQGSRRGCPCPRARLLGRDGRPSGPPAGVCRVEGRAPSRRRGDRAHARRPGRDGAAAADSRRRDSRIARDVAPPFGPGAAHCSAPHGRRSRRTSLPGEWSRARMRRTATWRSLVIASGTNCCRGWPSAIPPASGSRWPARRRTWRWTTTISSPRSRC